MSRIAPRSRRRKHGAPEQFGFAPIGVVRSCYTDRFGIPRQPGLVTAARAHVALYPEYSREEAFSGLAGFSHVWLVFVFHDSLEAGWKPKVRPPRLGGNRKVGVFASRSPHRPNPIGLSAVELVGLERFGKELRLHLRGTDLLDGTPVLDIKPYLPYADALPDARGGYAPNPPAAGRRVEFTRLARRQLLLADPEGATELPLLIAQVLRQDPRPGYMDRYPDRREFGMRIYDVDIRWRVAGDRWLVTSVTRTMR